MPVNRGRNRQKPDVFASTAGSPLVIGGRLVARRMKFNPAFIAGDAQFGIFLRAARSGR